MIEGARGGNAANSPHLLLATTSGFRPFSLSMNRLSILRLLAALAACLGFVSCAGTPSPAQSAAWPNRPFSSVRAFVYDCDADKSVDFIQSNGQVSKGVINGQGALLTADQVTRLMPVLTTATPRNGRTACFVPHHAFVFYDANGQRVANVDVCFTCALMKSHPEGLPKHVNYPALWAILEEAKVPLGHGSKFYQDLFRTTCKTR